VKTFKKKRPWRYRQEHLARPTAEVGLNQAIAVDPRDGMMRYHLGVAHGQMGQWQKSIAAYDAAISINPNFAEARSNRAICWLQMGDFAKGLPEYEWRLKSSFIPPRTVPIHQPRWDGSPLEGKTILLTAEQGLGDSIQFVRYAPLVAARGGRVLLAVQSQLLRLLERFPAVDRVLGPHPPLPVFDVHASLLSLPALCGTRLDSIPADIPYIHPDPGIAARWAHRVGPRDGRLRVGLVWAGSPENTHDQMRSIPAARYAALSAVPNIEFFSLQVGPAAAQVNAGPSGMRDFTSELTDFAETAGLIAQLDLIISVDTSVVHLAGAMGKKVWVLLHSTPDWRWMLDRVDSAWYPTVRLFRQRFRGEWDSVLAPMLEELHRVQL
jgi:hypothetical protein